MYVCITAKLWKMEKKQTNKKFTFVLSGLVTLGVIYGGYKYNHSLSHETTDDAQVEQNMTPIIPRVTGFIEKIYVLSIMILDKVQISQTIPMIYHK